MNTRKHISDSEILWQVEQICASAELGNKKQLCRLFRYLVNETLEGRAEQLKGYTIGIDVFEKGADFDPEQNPIVRIHAGRLRRMLRLYYLEGGKHDQIKIDIPKGKYIPYFSQHLPSSAGRDVSVNTQAISTTTSPNSPNRPSIEPSIAILPFKNLTGNPNYEYFSLGFAEELSVELTKFEDLLIYEPLLLSRSDLKGNDSIENLGVHFVIDGSLQLSKAHLKIVVKLIDTLAGEQLWADRFISDFSDQQLPELFESIARQVAGVLGSEYGIILQRLSAEYKRPKPQITDTYLAILKYYHFEAIQTPEAMEGAFEALKQALVTEPDSGIATAMLASMHGNLYMLDLDNAASAYEQMGLLAERALELDPHSYTIRVAYAYKCFVYNQKEHFFCEAEKCLERCVNASMKLVSLGMYLSLFGAWEKGMGILRKVKETGIGFPKFIYGTTCLYYYRQKDYARALEEANQYNLPYLFWGPMLRTAVMGQLNMKDEAGSHISHLMQLKPDFETEAVYLISRYVKEADLIDHLVDGLQKAGVKIKSVQLTG